MGQQVTKEQGATASGHHHGHHGPTPSSSAGANLQFAGSSSQLAPPPPKPLPSHLSDKVRVDNGGLVPTGVYTGPQDYDQHFVRQAIVDRRLAPFCKGSDEEDDFVDEKFNSECPICFLYYPSPLNFSRCCHQPICSECFVAMKRADPNHTNPPSSEARACPFCVEPDFGVTYTSLSKLLEKAGDSAVNDATDAANFAEMAIGTGGAGRGQQRKKVLPADDPDVITVDQIRPDWQMKLAQAHATIARRANRRVIMRQVGDRLIPIGISSSRAGADLAAAADSGRVNLNGPGGSIILQDGQLWPGSGAIGSGSAGTSSRRRGRGSRSDGPNSEIARFMRMTSGEEMEEIMMMEAMRLSLLDHEEQQKKEAEEAKKKKQAQQNESAAGPSSPRAGRASEGSSGSAEGTSTRASPPLPPAVPFDPQALGLSSGLMSELSELIEGGPTPNGGASSDRESSPSTGESIMSTPNRPVRTSMPAPAPVPVPEPVGNLGAAWNESSTNDGAKHSIQVSTRNVSGNTTPPSTSRFGGTRSPRNPFRRSMGESS